MNNNNYPLVNDKELHGIIFETFYQKNVIDTIYKPLYYVVNNIYEVLVKNRHILDSDVNETDLQLVWKFCENPEDGTSYLTANEKTLGLPIYVKIQETDKKSSPVKFMRVKLNKKTWSSTDKLYIRFSKEYLSGFQSTDFNRLMNDQNLWKELAHMIHYCVAINTNKKKKTPLASDIKGVPAQSKEIIENVLDMFSPERMALRIIRIRGYLTQQSSWSMMRESVLKKISENVNTLSYSGKKVKFNRNLVISGLLTNENISNPALLKTMFMQIWNYKMSGLRLDDVKELLIIGHYLYEYGIFDVNDEEKEILRYDSIKKFINNKNRKSETGYLVLATKVVKNLCNLLVDYERLLSFEALRYMPDMFSCDRRDLTRTVYDEYKEFLKIESSVGNHVLEDAISAESVDYESYDEEDSKEPEITFRQYRESLKLAEEQQITEDSSVIEEQERAAVD